MNLRTNNTSNKRKRVLPRSIRCPIKKRRQRRRRIVHRTTVNDLPNEILCEIMEKLDDDDDGVSSISAACVCRRWRQCVPADRRPARGSQYLIHCEKARARNLFNWAIECGCPLPKVECPLCDGEWTDSEDDDLFHVERYGIYGAEGVAMCKECAREERELRRAEQAMWYYLATRG